MTKQEAAKLTTLVRDAYDAAIAVRGQVVIGWLVHDIVSHWEIPMCAESDLLRVCAYEHVRTLVRGEMRRRDSVDEVDDGQLGLPGFPLLHRSYNVVRDGERTAVRTDLLSIDEIQQAMSELRRCSRGIDLHLNELQRYLDEVVIPREAAAS